MQRLLLSAALLVAVVPRLLGASWPFYNMDEATTAIVAKTILEGGIPYRDVADQRGPVTYSVYAMIFRAAGIYNMTAVHIAHACLMAILTLLVFRVGALQGRRTGVFAAALFAVTSYVSPATDLLAFHIEWCLILFTLVGVLLLWQGLAAERIVWLVPAGAAFALAALSKQPAIADFGLLLGLAVLVHSGGVNRLRRGMRAGAALLGGFGAVAAIYLASVYLAGALGDFGFNYWFYNTRYFLPAVPASQRVLDALTLQTRYPGRHAPLLVLFILGLVFRLRAWSRDGRPRRGTALLPFIPFVWALSSYVGAMWSGRASGHYFIQLLPAACWIGGHTLSRLLHHGRSAVRAARLATVRRRAVAAVIAIAVCAPVVAPNSAARSLVYRLVASVCSRCDRTTRGAEDVAKWLRQQPDQGTLFVWGFFPEIYVLADRMPASRFVLCTGLSGMIPWVDGRAVVPDSWRTFRNEMLLNPARYIVDTSPGEFRAYGTFPPEAAPELHELLERRYHIAATILDEGKPAFRIFEFTAGNRFAEDAHAPHSSCGNGTTPEPPAGPVRPPALRFALHKPTVRVQTSGPH